MAGTSKKKKQVYLTDTIQVIDYAKLDRGWHGVEVIKDHEHIQFASNPADSYAPNEVIYLYKDGGPSFQHKVVLNNSIFGTLPNGSSMSGVADEKGVVKVDGPIQTTKKTTTPYTPPPGPFDDTPARRKAHQQETAAIRKVMDLMLECDNIDDATKVLQMQKNGTATVTITLGETFELEAIIGTAEYINAAVKSFDDETKRRILRHAAHAFDIPKGNTWLR